MAWAQQQRSGRWTGYWRDSTGKVRSAGTWPHKARAMREASAKEADSRQPGWRSPDAARQTWGAWCAEWWPTRRIEASTRKTDEGRRDRWVMPRWGDVALCDITRHDVAAWAAQLRGGGMSPATVQRVVHLLGTSLRAAIDAEVLTANPAAGLHLPGSPEAQERYLTRDEFTAIRDELLEPEHAAVADVLVATGLRWGELAGLHVERVDLERGVLRVVEAADQNHRVIKPYPKGKRAREVPVPDWVAVHLAREGVGPCRVTHEQRRCRSPLVFTSPGGLLLDGGAFRRDWYRAVHAAGLGHCRVHDLRHTYASWLLQAGVPLAEVGRLMGHASPLTTARYGHLAETPRTAVLAALPDPDAWQMHGNVVADLTARRRTTRQGSPP